MSETPDEEAQRERAEELREEIESLDEPEADERGEGRREGESLREFTERRMREEREKGG